MYSIEINGLTKAAHDISQVRISYLICVDWIFEKCFQGQAKHPEGFAGKASWSQLPFLLSLAVYLPLNN